MPDTMNLPHGYIFTGNQAQGGTMIPPNYGSAAAPPPVPAAPPMPSMPPPMSAPPTGASMTPGITGPSAPPIPTDASTSTDTITRSNTPIARPSLLPPSAQGVAQVAPGHAVNRPMPVGPEGRTPADIQGKPFLSKAERDWFFTMFGPGGAPVTTSRGTPNSTVTPPSTGNAGLANTTELQSYALNSAVQNGLDPTLFSSLITHESGWDPRAVNPDSGAAGLGQFLPSTAATFGTTPDELRSNPRKALDLAATKLGGLKKMFGDDAMALAAYYVGEGTVGDAVRNNPQNWVQELDRLARERYKLTGQNAPSAFLSSVGAFRAVPTMGGR